MNNTNTTDLPCTAKCEIRDRLAEYEKEGFVTLSAFETAIAERDAQGQRADALDRALTMACEYLSFMSDRPMAEVRAYYMDMVEAEEAHRAAGEAKEASE